MNDGYIEYTGEPAAEPPPAPRFSRADRAAAIRAVSMLPEADLRDCVANMLQSSTEGYLVAALNGAARGVELRNTR